MFWKRSALLCYTAFDSKTQFLMKNKATFDTAENRFERNACTQQKAPHLCGGETIPWLWEGMMGVVPIKGEFGKS